MLLKAMDYFQISKAQHTSNVKGQYANKRRKDYFRASELGNLQKGRRKLIYGFFADRIAKDSKSAHNLRQLENGDYVHERYQTAWKQMGILVYRDGKESMERQVTSKNDPFLSQFDWELNGHYDGELDLNLIRAYALGKVTVTSEKQGDEWVLVPALDFDYGRQIGYFDEEGELSPNYNPLSMVADIKTMNPFSFKKLKEGGTEPIEGYLSQIMFYMYMLDTPYGCIYIENKANNEILEVQVVWKDLRGGQYDFLPDYHGEQEAHVMRVYVDSERFEKIISDVDQTWEIIKQLEKARETGDYEAVIHNLPERCSSNPDTFPCRWSTGQCEFFEHCWNTTHQGYSLMEGDASEEVKKMVEVLKPSPFNEDGTLKKADPVKEYVNEKGERAFQCILCAKEVTFRRLVAGMKKCTHCGYVNEVTK